MMNAQLRWIKFGHPEGHFDSAGNKKVLKIADKTVKKVERGTAGKLRLTRIQFKSTYNLDLSGRPYMVIMQLIDNEGNVVANN